MAHHPTNLGEGAMVPRRVNDYDQVDAVEAAPHSRQRDVHKLAEE